MRHFHFFLVALLISTGSGFAQDNSESVAIALQGKGDCKTRTFTLQDNWRIETASEAPIKVRLRPDDGGLARTLIEPQGGSAAVTSYNASSPPMAKGGTYGFEIETTGMWQITIFESGFTQHLSIGQSQPYSPSTPSSAAPSTTASGSPYPQPMVPGMSNPMTTSMPNDRVVAMFNGSVGQTSTRPFTVRNGWEVQWTSFGSASKITLMPADGSNPTVISDGSSTDANTPSPASPTSPNMPPGMSRYPNPYMGMGQMQKGSSYEATGGTFTLQVDGKAPWSIRIVEVNGTTGSSDPNSPATMVNGMVMPNPGMTAPVAPAAPAPVVKLTDDQARAVVLIKGDKAEGTGFLVKMPDGPVVVTNIHVVADNPNLKITTNSGMPIKMLSAKAAADRDLAVLSIQDAGYSYLEMMANLSQTVQTGDEVVTPGNSEGGEVMLNTGGKVLGIGPERIEIDNPIYHGNSGGPIFHTKSGKVLGVVTEAMKVDTSNSLDKASFANRNSAISGSMRYFGLRLDTVTSWVPIDWARLQTETAFLDDFHHQSRSLDSYLNSSENSQAPDAHLYRSDEKIMKANDNFTREVSGSDISQRIQALKGLLFDLQGIADYNLSQVQNANNFYSFDQDRAQNEADYRTALKKELDSIGNDVGRLGGLPRTNN